uniref:Uncharacterized protein n=1 Tax=Octopus bimaculoides TaxID=37653 RepID=A0A0L8HCP5_OCTBM
MNSEITVYKNQIFQLFAMLNLSLLFDLKQAIGNNISIFPLRDPEINRRHKSSTSSQYIIQLHKAVETTTTTTTTTTKGGKKELMANVFMKKGCLILFPEILIKTIKETIKRKIVNFYQWHEYHL